MPKLVVMGATLHCQKGSKDCALTPCEVNSIVSGTAVVASMLDHQVGENIADFDVCKVDGAKCDPLTPLPWDLAWTNMLVGSAPPVSAESKLRCFRKGVHEITIAYEGQVTIELGCAPPPDSAWGLMGFIGDALDVVMMTDVANAPRPGDCLVDSESQVMQSLDFAASVVPPARLLQVIRLRRALAPAGLSRPHVADTKLDSIIDQLYREKAAVGNGSTADAIRHTRRTEELVGGSDHIKKGVDRRKELKSWLRSNPHASQADRDAAQSVIDDLTDALGKGYE